MKNNTAIIENLKKCNYSTDELYTKFTEILDSKDRENAIIYDQLKFEFDRLKVIVDLIPNTISWINKDLTYFGANNALAKTCGLTPEDFINRPIGFHTKEKFFYDFATDLFRSNQDTLYRELDANISGVVHTFLVTGTKLSNNEKAVVIGVDITELKNLKGHVKFTEKLATLGEMFAGIIHDINNPLMMIDASVKKIKKKTTDEETLEILNKIQMSSSKVTKIVQGIKIYIRQDEEIPFQVESLGQIIDDAVIICENKLKVQNVKIILDEKLTHIKLDCNFTQLFQVFVNLITNAIDAISGLQDKWIEIKDTSESQNSEYLIIHFIDSGLGIPLELQEKIFQAFYTTKGRGVGSGLGLSLCSKILEAHHGSISILKEKPNTTFEIKLLRHRDI